MCLYKTISIPYGDSINRIITPFFEKLISVAGLQSSTGTMDESIEKAAAREYIESAESETTFTTKRANDLEKEVTIRDVITKHPQLAWWVFFWAMSAVGWGFDVQVNGAMISVPAFRRDFGYRTPTNFLSNDLMC